MAFFTPTERTLFSAGVLLIVVPIVLLLLVVLVAAIVFGGASGAVAGLLILGFLVMALRRGRQSR